MGWKGWGVTVGAATLVLLGIVANSPAEQTTKHRIVRYDPAPVPVLSPNVHISWSFRNRDWDLHDETVTYALLMDGHPTVYREVRAHMNGPLAEQLPFEVEIPRAQFHKYGLAVVARRESTGEWDGAARPTLRAGDVLDVP